MTVCVVNGCHNTTDKTKQQSTVQFHVFPSNPIIADLWIKKIRANRNDSCWKPHKSAVVCSIHFDDKDKYVSKCGLSRIRKGAIPTKNIPIFITEEEYDGNKLSNGTQNGQERVSQPGVSSDNTNKDASLKTESAQSLSKALSSDSELDYVFDTPKEAALRIQLNKKIKFHQKLSKKIKALLQQNRRLQTRNRTLKKTLKKLSKKYNIDKSDISDNLSEDEEEENVILPVECVLVE